MKYIVDIKGEIEGDYEIIGKYEEEPLTLTVNLTDEDIETLKRLMKDCKPQILYEDTSEVLVERPQGDWIPVSERLPEKNMACLVSVGNFNLTQVAVYSDLMQTINHKIFYQGDYGHDNFVNITEHVKAWQPLPKPYESEDRK